MPTAPKKEPGQILVADLLAKAEKTFSGDIYVNHIQVSLTDHELFIDFYYTSPQVSKTSPVKMQHVGRMIAPVALAKGLATALANMVANYEADNNVNLPNSRIPDPSDKITIWP